MSIHVKSQAVLLPNCPYSHPLVLCSQGFFRGGGGGGAPEHLPPSSPLPLGTDIVKFCASGESYFVPPPSAQILKETLLGIIITTMICVR